MKKALVIGLNDYPNSPLNWCVNDANEVADLISLNGDGSENFNTFKIAGDCDNDKLYSSIEKLFSDDDDIALLYFSGHGFEEDGGRICGTNTDGSSIGIRMDDIIKLANESRCKNRIVILDCCYAAKLGGYSMMPDGNSHLSQGLTIMAACQTWQTAQEEDNIQHGVFTNLLIEGLKGGAADINGNITPASLYSFVDQSLGAWQQRPVFKTNTSRFIPVRKVPAKVSTKVLRNLTVYFKRPDDEFKLNPSFEFTNCPTVNHKILQPYASKENVTKFKELQLLESVGLVKPTGTNHMYFAAMESKSCKLTKLGQHYWKLSKKEQEIKTGEI